MKLPIIMPLLQKEDPGIQIAVTVKTPLQALNKPPKPCDLEPETIEEKVARYCELIDSGHESSYEWDVIRELYNRISLDKKNGHCTPRRKRLLLIMAPVINRYGNEDPRGIEWDLETTKDTAGRMNDENY